jgi:hypothetical protein
MRDECVRGGGREERDEESLSGLFGLSGLFCWPDRKANQRNQRDQKDQRNQMNQINQLIAASGISHHPAGEKIDRQMEMIHPLSIDSQFSSTGSEVGLFAGCGLGFAGVVTVGLGARSV